VGVKAPRILIILLIVVLGAGSGLCSDSRVTLELVGASQGPSVSSGSNWGWWNPDKYTDGWDPDESSSFGLADARLLVAGASYTVILEGEWYPNLDATGDFPAPDSASSVTQELTLKTGIYDLGLGRWFGRDDRNGVLPWIGATYMDINESLTTNAPSDSSYPEGTDNASSGLWGVVVGADGSITVWQSLDVTGRLLFRWATGTRKATISSQDPGGGDDGGSVEVSDSIDHMMWGLDVGVRWHATRRFALELGWRLRDRTLDDGPASFGGPQIKLAFDF
jgi:hypothetical protein